MAATQAACTGRARLKAVGARARAERTENMRCMVVTLEVSQLSGWLNPPYCPAESKGGRAMREEVYRPVGVRALSGGDAVDVHAGRARLKAGGQGTGGAHVEHEGHVRDLGRVEVERLVELRRALPSRKEGMRRGKRCGTGGVRALGGGDAGGMHREGQTQGCGGQGTRGAHVEHVAHGRDARSVPIGNVPVETMNFMDDPIPIFIVVRVV